MTLMARELRRLTRKIVDLDRRVALGDLDGKVVAIDHDKRRLRLEIGKTSDGQPILSPWVRWAESGGNALLKVHIPPELGTLMRLESPSGTIGEGSVARWATYTDANGAPSKASDAGVMATAGCEISLGRDGELVIKASKKLSLDVGGEALTIDPDEIRAGKVLRAKGGSRPAHYVGGKDSHGDTAIDGNENLLI